VEVVDRVKERLIGLGWTVANDSPLAVLDACRGRLGDVRDLVRRVVAGGRAWVAPTTFEGRDVVRICATNGETTLKDVDVLVAALNAEARTCAGRVSGRRGLRSPPPNGNSPA